MVKLENITMLAVDTLNYGGAIAALKKSIKQCKFGAVKFLTDVDIKIDGIEILKIDRLKSKEEYSNFIVKELNKYFNTEYVLIIQHDGFILNGDCWDDEFLKYDYTGGTWLYIDGKNVGNGGFSLRTKRLQEILAEDDNIEITHPEDEITARLYRTYLEKKYLISFAPEEVANKFSFELNEPIQKTFGFHGYFWGEFKPHIVIKRTAALGDVIMCEPLIDYYFKKGYQVVLDTLPQFMSVFFQYRHPLKHISQINPKIVPEKIINLDGAYESKPKQSVLQSYYEFAGITDAPLVNSKLNLKAGKDEMLFQKYILLHLDNTGMEYRNQHGIDWNFVVQYYQRLGYLVFQIGRRMKEVVAPYLNTVTLEMLMFSINGADCIIGIDSSPCQIAVALNVPTVIMFGSVSPKLRYNNFSKIQVVHTDCPTSAKRFCYHETENSEVGNKCEFNESEPPCTVYTHFNILNAVNKLL